ncbi:MAG TPA: pyridoxal-dependent decarboxylase [Saprospiraceae bacterium]|nr:pyridoxal-dependent decarboxylase [Saprospiraceae bacterium]
MVPEIFNNTPGGRAAFEALAQKVVQWISNYYSQIESFPVRSPLQPGDIYRQFPDRFPSEPVSDDMVFKVLNEVILPGITHWQHPNFYAFFPSNTSFPSIAAEMLTAGIAAQCMIWESSPAAAELEQRCMEWCRELLGLPKAWEGVIQDTASTATLTALLTAREWKSGFRISKRGFDGSVYRIYASSQAHSSVEKAVRLAGFGTENLVSIETDEHLALLPDKLEQAIRADRQNGFIPTCIVSTFGTTGVGAIDPIPEISDIANRYGIWHHVDAAYLGTGLMLDEFVHLRHGLEGADSFVFNPHKWMFVQFDCSAYFVRDPELLVRTMSINPSYLMTAQGDVVNDYRDWGIPLGRRFRALKLWMTMQLLGTDALKEKLTHHIALTRQVEEWLLADTHFELAYPRSFNILTFRIKRELDPDGKMTKILSLKINDSGKAYMTFAVIQDRGLIRWVIGQTYVEERHMVETWELIMGLMESLGLRPKAKDI